MIIKAEEIKLVDIDTIIENPKNNNKHPKEQIERLAKLIRYGGFRNPLVISKRTGFLVAGHGRLLAAKELEMTHVPVIYQDFENDAMEYQYMTSDNAIASWAELDLAKINLELPELGPDFDLEVLGLKNFTLDFSEKELPQLKEQNVNFGHKLEISCDSEENQRQLYDQLIGDGYEVRILS